MKLPQIALTGPKKSSSVDVNDAIFGAPINWLLLTQVIEAYRANQRRSHAKKQTRSEVTATKTKWYRQKGTGRARHGAQNVNLFRGGGLAHGPKGIENFSRKITQKMKQKSLASALSALADKERVKIGVGATEFTGRTPEAQDALLRISEDPKEKVLAIVAADYQGFLQAAKNIERLMLTRADRVNALEVANADQVVVMEEALPTLLQRVGAISRSHENKSVSTESTAKVKSKTTTKTKATKAKTKSSTQKAAKKSKTADKKSKPAAKKSTKVKKQEK